MAVILEHIVKARLAPLRLTVPKGGQCVSAEEARDLAAELGGSLVVKALIPTGRRAKGGGVRFVESPEECADVAGQILGSTVNGFIVRSVLVEQKVDIVREYYFSLAPDPSARAMVAVFTRDGGVEVEDALHSGEGVARATCDADGSFPEFRARQLVIEADVTGPEISLLAGAIQDLIQFGTSSDATLLEINPLAITADGSICAAGAMLSIDDRALSRQETFAEGTVEAVDLYGRELTPLELRIREVNAEHKGGQHRIMEFEDGDIGCMISGGGAGLVGLDAIWRAGGRPATAFDQTSGQVEEHFFHTTSGVLELDRVRGLIIGSNIGAMGPVPIRMRGIVRALKASTRDFTTFPIVVRLAGPEDDEARRLIAEVPDVHYFGDEVTIEEAVEHLITLVQELPA